MADAVWEARREDPWTPARRPATTTTATATTAVTSPFTGSAASSWGWSFCWPERRTPAWPVTSAGSVPAMTSSTWAAVPAWRCARHAAAGRPVRGWTRPRRCSAWVAWCRDAPSPTSRARPRPCPSRTDRPRWPGRWRRPTDWADVEQALAELRRVLRPGGRLLHPRAPSGRCGARPPRARARARDTATVGVDGTTRKQRPSLPSAAGGVHRRTHRARRGSGSVRLWLCWPSGISDRLMTGS